MRDRVLEQDYYPARRLDPAEVGSLICFAPHPDDEVIGCGGVLALVAHLSADVLTIIVTDGQAQAAGSGSRREESRAALSQLGLPEPLFWGLGDRRLSVSPQLTEQIERVLRERRPTHVLVPALTEPHPDHQSLALAVTRAAEQIGKQDLTLLFYEVGAPMVPNAWVDISRVADQKWSALRCFSSQLDRQPYDDLARAMATLRAHGRGVSAAEAFFMVTVAELGQRSRAMITPTAVRARARLSAAQSSSDLPLVSIVVRSSGRPSLEEALESIAQQHYANLEVVLVCALGQTHNSNDFPSGLLVREIMPEPGQIQGRAQSANLGLSEAQGELILFLDDDDLLDPDHIERLVGALLQSPKSPAAYAGVRVEDRTGALIAVYDEPWSAERLLAINFIPIHAVLFRRASAQHAGVRFPEHLPVLEDWAFWRALSLSAGDFVHVPGVSAVYRKLDQGSGLASAGPNDWRIWQERILSDWMSTQPHEAMAGLLAWHARSLSECLADLRSARRQVESLQADHLRQTEELHRQFEGERLAAAERAAQSLRSAEQQIREALESRASLQQSYEHQLQQLLDDRDRLKAGYEAQMAVLESQRTALESSLRRITSSRIWRWSAPIRSMLRRWSS